MSDVWPIVHAERAALVEDLARLTDEQWTQQSLCGEWTVRDVAAHLVNTAKTTRFGFMRDLARARFDFDRQNAQGVARELGVDPTETLDRLRTSRPAPPLRQPTSTAGSSRRSCTARTSAGRS